VKKQGTLTIYWKKSQWQHAQKNSDGDVLEQTMMVTRYN
jgi:hypothetical protein